MEKLIKMQAIIEFPAGDCELIGGDFYLCGYSGYEPVRLSYVASYGCGYNDGGH